MALERPPRRLRPLPLAVGAIVVLVAVGIVALWPPSVAGTAPPEPLQTAEIRAVEVLPPTPEGLETARVQLAVTSGPDAGERVTTETQLSGLPTLEVGDTVMVTGNAATGFYIADYERSSALLWLLALFVAVVVVMGRWHGLRSLLGLAFSLFVVVRFIVPAILAGRPPALVALVGAVAVMLVTLYLTHGVSTRTTTAVLGTTVALAITIGLGLTFIDVAAITGFSSEEASFATVVVEDLDVTGLVLAGLIIAALGVLDDVTVAQAATVYALHDTDPEQSVPTLFRSAMVVGRDHIASTVNTLFLAYAGASLALLVLFSTSGRGLVEIVTSEIVATEVVKTIVGSLGLISAVPLTTALAATMATRRAPGEVAASRRRAGHAHHG